MLISAQFSNAISSEVPGLINFMTQGFKYSRIGIFEKNCTLKTTNNCDNDRKKEGGI